MSMFGSIPMQEQFYGVRPRTIGELLGQTAVIYRDHFHSIVGTSAAIIIPATALQVFFFFVMVGSNDILAIFLLQILAGLILAGTVAAAVAAITAATARILVSGKTTVVEAFDYSMPRVVTTLKASYLIYFITSFLTWTMIGFPVALFLSVAWLVTIQVVVLEGTGARVALGRSWELTRGNRLRVLATIILTAIITALMMSFFFLPALAVMLRPVIVEGSGEPPVLAWVLAGLFWIIGAVLVFPLQYLAWTLVYFDLRARNDGLAVEPQPPMMAGTAPAAPQMD